MPRVTWDEQNEADGLIGERRSQFDELVGGARRTAYERESIGNELDAVGAGQRDSELEGLANEYREGYEADIDPAFYDASRRVASQWASRGLGMSGMALEGRGTGSQLDAQFAAAAARAQARQRSIDRARAGRRAQLLDELSIYEDSARALAEQSRLAAEDRATDLGALGTLATIAAVA